MPVKCLECGTETTDDITPISCLTCKSSFHPKCVSVDSDGKILKCRQCALAMLPIKVPDAPKAGRIKSLRSGSSSCRSTKSVKNELKLLEAQRKLEIKAQEDLEAERAKYFAEKEKSIKSKLDSDLKYLKDKTLLEQELEELDEEYENQSITSQQLANERIEKWKADNARNESPELQANVGQQVKAGLTSAPGKCPPPGVSSYVLNRGCVKNSDQEANKGQSPVVTSALDCGVSVILPPASRECVKNYEQEADEFQPPVMTSALNCGASVNRPPTSTQLKTVRTLTREQLAARSSDMKTLPVFTGISKEWPVFLQQFNQSTELCGFDNVDNIVRLRNCIKGNARIVVDGALSYPENVGHIITTLSQIFGRPEFILNDLMNDVRQLQCIRLERFDEIIHLSVLVSNMVSTMIAAKMSDHMWNPLLLQELVGKLPTQMKREWAKYSSVLSSASLETFSFWLSERTVECSSLLTEPPVFGESKKKKNIVNLHNTESCDVCTGSCTNVGQCKKFIEMSYKEKWNTVKNLQLCRLCLKRHRGRCSLAKICGVNECPYMHHPKLHKTKDDLREEVQSLPNGIVNSHSSSDFKEVFFKILPITLKNEEKVVHTFALLDDGSSVTLVEEWVADALEIDGEADELLLKWTGDTHKVERNSKRFSVMVTGTGERVFNLQNARTVSSLNLPKQTVSLAALSQQFNHLRNLPIESYVNKQPSILIGLDNAKLTTCLKLREGKSNEPVAAKTRLGWVIFGGGFSTELKTYHTCKCQHDLDMEMDRTLKSFLALENLLIDKPEKPLLSLEDSRALKIMAETTKYLGGRYEIGLIWKFDKFVVPDSYSMALRRLTCFERKLSKDPELLNNISKQLEEYVDKGYAEKISSNHRSEQSWYLPIFAVRNPNKPDKVRIVWDAAAEVENVSLNTLLLKGPDQLTDLPGVLFRFRQFEIAIAGDIKQMFHQVRIREADRPFLRFLWRVSPKSEVDVYQMNVMIFGASCSPSCSQYIKNINAERFSEEMPLAVKAIKSNHYVDDWLESVESEQEAIKLIQQVTEIHEKGGFKICNFLSNSQFVLENISNTNPVTTKMFKEEDDMSEKILGMWWDMESDMFVYSLKYHKVDKKVLAGERLPTKREVLKLLMSIFDPLGLISHFLIYPKILMQEVWRSGIGWDDVIPVCLQAKWKTWIKALSIVESFQVPRWYSISSKDAVDLHVFVDASREAYAAACYLRTCNGSRVHCSLLSAKTKVAPLKLLSIPRLELSAAVLGCRIASKVVSQHTIKFRSVTFWTDSKTVWCWLNSDHRLYKPFVAFRIAEILETTSPQQWRWLQSNLNIADAATRQIIPSEKDNKEWFYGPEFLWRIDEETWPKKASTAETTEVELRAHILHQIEVCKCPIEYSRFSKWLRISRSVAFVRRFIFNCRASIRKADLLTGPLKKHEIRLAEIDCFKIAQHDVFIDEIAELKNGDTVNKKSHIFKMTPFLDGDGLLRSSSRLATMTDVSGDFINPIILPNSHYIVFLLLHYYHDKYKHQNHETVFHEVQQRFSIPSLRSALKKTRSDCQHCKNKKAGPVVPLMGNLPKARISPFTNPFSYIGIDYFGPYFVAVRRSREKRWGVLITCLNTRAVHLDICETLTTDSCICAIKRFMSRRGEPLEIYSDQGTNFKGTNNELKEAILKLDQEELASEFTTSYMQWHFNPPLAPHMGGVWERMVRSVKQALDFAMSNSTRTPREEVLRTMMCEAEYVVNSRPLTYIPLEAETSEVLTPNHFLMGSSSGIRAFGVDSNDSEHARENWRRSNGLMKHFWKRWIREYLPIIRRRSKWFDDVRELEVGDVVVMVEDNYEKHLWRKAVVIDVTKSRDGHVRKATVQTAIKKIYERAAAKLAILDVRKESYANTSPTDALPRGSVASNIDDLSSHE